MIRGIAIKNGKLKLVLLGDDSIDKEMLKALDGATVRVIKDNFKVADQNIVDGLLIELPTGTQET